MKQMNNRQAAIFSIALSAAAMLVLWIYKWPLLQLPFFWDEAWSYAPAVFAMYENHPCIFPGCIATDLYRGHPLWFYFMNSMLAKIAGFTPFTLHFFSLLTATLFSVFFYSLLRSYTNPLFAFTGTVLLLSQEVFIVQSSFLLPEIFVSFMTMAAAICLVRGRKFWFILFATLLVLTKEAGFLIAGTMLFTAFMIAVTTEKRTFLSSLLYFSVLSVPIFAGAVFYLFQKAYCGWYFYPEHVQMFSFHANPLIPKLMLVRDFTFKAQGRIAVTLITASAVIALFFLRRRIKTAPVAGSMKLTVILVAVFTFYALFSALNFLMLRYLLPLVVIFIFLSTVWCYRACAAGFRISPWLMCIAIVISLYSTSVSDNSWIDDVSVNYKDDVIVHQRTVRFMEEQGTQPGEIFTHFLMKCYLTRHELFYLQGPAFEEVNTKNVHAAAQYYIFSNLELHQPDYDAVKTNDSLVLIKRFDEGQAWCEIYRRK